MHEISIAQAIVDVAVEEAKKANAQRILSITVSLGELSGVVAHYLQFCFPIVAKDTPLEGAELLVEAVAGEGWCAACDKAFPLPEYLAPCPDCGGFTTDVRSGQELNVTSMEID